MAFVAQLDLGQIAPLAGGVLPVAGLVSLARPQPPSELQADARFAAAHLLPQAI